MIEWIRIGTIGVTVIGIGFAFRKDLHPIVLSGVLIVVAGALAYWI